MKHIKNTEGINPTPQFFADQHTGEFAQILPDTYMIKGAKNDRGFDQAYALKRRNKEEYLLIDVVEQATKEAVEKLIHNGGKILGILISGESVLKDAYADMGTLSEDAEGAEIYIHSNVSTGDNFPTKDLTQNDSLLSSFDLEVQDLSESGKGEILIYCSSNDGMLFPGDSAKGSDYDSDNLSYYRDVIHNKSLDFEIGQGWVTYNKDFTYLFPRKGKPAVDVDLGTRTAILNRLRKGE